MVIYILEENCYGKCVCLIIRNVFVCIVFYEKLNFFSGEFFFVLFFDDDIYYFYVWLLIFFD